MLYLAHYTHSRWRHSETATHYELWSARQGSYNLFVSRAVAGAGREYSEDRQRRNEECGRHDDCDVVDRPPLEVEDVVDLKKAYRPIFFDSSNNSLIRKVQPYLNPGLALLDKVHVPHRYVK